MWYWVITATGCDICPLFKAKERYQGSPINNPVVAKASRWCCRSDPHSCWSLWKFSCAFRVSASSFRCGRVQGLDTKSTEAVDARLRALAGKVRSGGAAAGAGPRPGHRAGGFVVPSRGGRRAAGAGGEEVPGAWVWNNSDGKWSGEAHRQPRPGSGLICGLVAFRSGCQFGKQEAAGWIEQKGEISILMRRLLIASPPSSPPPSWMKAGVRASTLTPPPAFALLGGSPPGKDGPGFQSPRREKMKQRRGLPPPPPPPPPERAARGALRGRAPAAPAARWRQPSTPGEG